MIFVSSREYHTLNNLNLWPKTNSTEYTQKQQHQNWQQWQQRDEAWQKIVLPQGILFRHDAYMLLTSFSCSEAFIVSRYSQRALFDGGKLLAFMESKLVYLQLLLMPIVARFSRSSHRGLSSSITTEGGAGRYWGNKRIVPKDENSLGHKKDATFCLIRSITQ